MKFLNQKTLSIILIVTMSIYCVFLNKKLTQLESRIDILTKSLDSEISENNTLRSDNSELMIDIGRYEIILSRIDEEHPGLVDKASSNLE